MVSGIIKRGDDMTYGDIISEFCQKFPNAEYEDIRPCCEAYGVPTIKYAIVVWLKDKSKIIYISDNARKYFENDNQKR